MSRVTRREWYERVNAAWPLPVPPLTGPEAVRAFRRLYRFAFGRLPALPVRLTTGNRYPVRQRRGAWYVNPEGGWQGLVHLLSHYAEPGHHGGAHARCELRMIKEVVRRGWLDGRLRDRPRAPAPALDPRARRHALARAAVARWEAKSRRAARALAKARRRLGYYERSALASRVSVV